MILNILDFKRTPNEAVSLPRIHNQLLPDEVVYEATVSPHVLQLLSHDGNRLREKETAGNVEQVIWVNGDEIWAASDWRKGGSPAGY